MKKLIASIIGLILTFVLWYTATWHNPTTCDIQPFLKTHSFLITSDQTATPATDESLRTAWQSYESSQKAGNYPWPFGVTPELRAVYAKHIWPFKDAICVVIAGVLLLSQIILFIVPVSRRQRNYLAETFDDLLALFDGDGEQTRITLYRPEVGIWFLPRYVSRCFLNLEALRHHLQKGLILYHLRKMPLPWRNYLTPFKRRGTPCEHPPSSTHFTIARDPKHTEGIVAHVWCTGKTYCPELEGATIPQLPEKAIINCASVADISDENERMTVQKYMTLGKIHSLDTLRAIHRFYTHVWAVQIKYGKTPLGVLIIDSNMDANPFEDGRIQQALVLYSQTLGMTLGTFCN